MSGPEQSASGASANGDAPSVLAGLSRTRPQRSTARRVAARDANGSAPRKQAKRATTRTARATTGKQAPARKPAGKPPRPTAASGERAQGTSARAARRVKTTANGAKARANGAKGTPARARGRARTAVREPEPVPPQGFESEGDRVSGPVAPPGGAELLATAAEVVSELARASVSTGERVLRDIFSRLPGA